MDWNWMNERFVFAWRNKHVCCLFLPQNWCVQLISCEIFVCYHRMNCSVISDTKKKKIKKNESPVLPKFFGSLFLVLLHPVWMQDCGACFIFFFLMFFAFLQRIMLYISFTLLPSCIFSITIFIQKWLCEPLLRK